MLRKALPVLGALAVAGAVIALWPRHQRTPEDEVRALVAQVVGSAEKKDIGGVMETLAPNFHGSSGMGREELKGYLLGQLLRGDAPLVLNPRLEVTVESPDAATFSGTFVFTRGVAGQGAEGSRYEVEGRVERSDGDWRFVSASWH